MFILKHANHYTASGVVDSWHFAAFYSTRTPSGGQGRNY